MHLAASANLPRSLDGCAKAVGVGYAVDLKDNNILLRITNANKTPVPTPADLKWLGDRCMQDVLMEEQTLVRLPGWPGVRPWLNMPAIDRRINDRGVLLDVKLAQGMAKAAAIETVRLDVEMDKITDRRVGAATQVEALKHWLLQRGIPVPEIAAPASEDEPDDDDEAAPDEKGSRYRLRKRDIANLIALPGIDDRSKRALQIRQEAAKASVRKLRSMLRYASPDGRLRDALVMMGAQGTGRWSSTGWQGHNMVRDVFANKDEVADANGLNPKKDKHEIERLMAVALATAIEVGSAGDPEMIRMLYGAVLPWCSRMMRRTLTARLGYLMLNGDYSSIEARIPAWLAGEQHIVDAYARGEDIYRINAAPVYGMEPAALTKTQRQVGKVMELSLGFAGGIGAFVPMAQNYGLVISPQEALPLVNTFRGNRPNTVAFWDSNLGAAIAAVQYPGREFAVAPLGLITWKYVDGSKLLCRLPSGRYLTYWQPKLVQGFWADGKPKPFLDLTVLAVRGKSVIRRTLWRGLAVENVTQAIAADMLACALENMDNAGLPVVMHVHDFAGAEVEEHRATQAMPVFEDCMLNMPAWTKGLPVAIEADISARFG